MYSISKDTEQVILGGLLGDSYLAKQASGNCYLYLAHCPAQLDYLKWKLSFFEKDNLMTPRGIFSVISNKKYLQYRFVTKTLPLFNSYRHLFYESGKKKVTRHILNMLNPLGLAIWYMDDGSRTLNWYTKKDGTRTIRTRRMGISTDGFTFEEHEIIKQYFKVVWNIDIMIHKSKNNRFRTAINATNGKKFIEIIEPHIVPCMQYKIDMKYNITHPIKDDDILCSNGRSLEVDRNELPCKEISLQVTN